MAAPQTVIQCMIILSSPNIKIRKGLAKYMFELKESRHFLDVSNCVLFKAIARSYTEIPLGWKVT